jgi:hypothetical protein
MKCVYIFVVVLKIKSGSFPKQHEPVYRYNGDKKCLRRYELLRLHNKPSLRFEVKLGLRGKMEKREELETDRVRFV